MSTNAGSEEAGPVRQERDGAVLLIELNRPRELNALSPELVATLHSALAEAEADEAVRAIVLTGAGRAFCSGFDMGGERTPPKTTEEFLRIRSLGNDLGTQRLQSMLEMQTPVIAAVNGWCMGGGLWYALACDITIAGQSAVFAQPEVRHVSNGSFLLGALMGWKNAHRYGITGDHFDAPEALRLGVVNEVVPDESLLETAMALARRIALVPRASVRTNKAIANSGLMADGLWSAMQLNSVLSTVVMASNDTEDAGHLVAARAEGMRAFLDARDGPFRPEPFGPKSKKA